MSIGRTPVFFASTPQSSPPGSPKLPRLRRNERKISADQTLLSHLRTSIEQRNFPDAMDVIKLMEKHEHQYEKLENMEKLEKRLSFVNKVAEDSLIQVNSLSQENGLIVEDVKKLKEENKIYQKEIKKIISEKSALEITNVQLSSKCSRMAETLTSREIGNAEKCRKSSAEVSQLREQNFKLNEENVALRSSSQKLQNEKIETIKENAKLKFVHEKLSKENEKLKMISQSYKYEINNLIAADTRKVKIDNRQKMGEMLLLKINDLLSNKNISLVSDREVKKLENRKQAVFHYLEKIQPEPSIIPETQNFQETSVLESHSDLLDGIEEAIKKLELSLS